MIRSVSSPAVNTSPHTADPKPWVGLTEAAEILGGLSVNALNAWLHRNPTFRAAARACQPGGPKGSWLLNRERLLNIDQALIDAARAEAETDTAA